MRFENLGVKKELLEAAREKGFESLTSIQAQAMKPALDGRDVVGQAETGSGKTLAFVMPILNRLAPGRGIQVLVLTPTRELCVQVTDVFKEFGRQLGFRAVSIYGGVGIEPQIKALHTADIVVGTPGRILDHMGRGTVNFSGVRVLVLDETDRMFEMGFIEDVERIISATPRDRQTLMFSATIFDQVLEIMQRHLRDPVIVRTRSYVDPGKLRQVYYDILNQNEKFSLLVHLLRNDPGPGVAIVFVATRRESDILATNLRRQGINALAIHGGMEQNKRTRSLDSLKKEEIDVLVATDVAARGLDIRNVSKIYNYDVPKTGKEYLHRIGRTARAGDKGLAVTLLTQRDHDNLRRIFNDPNIEVERAEMPGFQRLFFNRFPDGQKHSGRGGGGGRGGRYRSHDESGRSGGRRYSRGGYRSGEGYNRDERRHHHDRGDTHVGYQHGDRYEPSHKSQGGHYPGHSRRRRYR